jgi:hypothetical protein
MGMQLIPALLRFTGSTIISTGAYIFLQKQLEELDLPEGSVVGLDSDGFTGFLEQLSNEHSVEIASVISLLMEVLLLRGRGGAKLSGSQRGAGFTWSAKSRSGQNADVAKLEMVNLSRRNGVKSGDTMALTVVTNASQARVINTVKVPKSSWLAGTPSAATLTGGLMAVMLARLSSDDHEQLKNDISDALISADDVTLGKSRYGRPDVLDTLTNPWVSEVDTFIRVFDRFYRAPEAYDALCDLSYSMNHTSSLTNHFLTHGADPVDAVRASESIRAIARSVVDSSIQTGSDPDDYMERIDTLNAIWFVGKNARELNYDLENYNDSEYEDKVENMDRAQLKPNFERTNVFSNLFQVK